jgi:hypothetical protein
MRDVEPIGFEVNLSLNALMSQVRFHFLHGHFIHRKDCSDVAS